MRRDDLAADLVRRRSEDGYLFPAYGDYCFAGVPGAVYDLLGADVGPTLPADAFDANAFDADATDADAFDTDAIGADAVATGGAGAGIDRVVVVLVDGFGYEQWRRLVGGAGAAFLAGVEEAGTVTPLTSIFPSETAAAIPTYHAARYPHEHGVHGWFQRAPGLDDIVLPLPFATADGRPMGEAHPEFRREDLFLADEHYDRTSEVGIETRKVVPEGIARGDSRAIGYDDLDGFAETLGDAVGGADPRSVTFAYLPHVDAAGHRAGTRATVYREALADVDEAVARGLSNVSGDVAERTLVVVTADHGHVDTDPGTNVDLREPRFEALWGLFERRSDGTAVPPTGSPRQLHLHLRDADGAEAAARRIVERELDALAFSTEAAVERELWGPGEYGEAFRGRCGDLLVVPRKCGVWYEGDELGLVGMHGGLAREEMLVPFATARLAALR